MGAGGWAAPDGRSALALVAEALALSVEDLERALTTRQISVRKEGGVERLSSPHTPEQSADARDGLAKAVFGSVFAWLVSKINERLRGQREEAELEAAPSGEAGPDGGVEGGAAAAEAEAVAAASVKTICILEIVGFESFESNGFEQVRARVRVRVKVRVRVRRSSGSTPSSR